MAFDIKNFVINRVVRGIAVAHGDNPDLNISAGDVLFSIDQITNPSLSCTSESVDAVDALNVPIATFYRAKNCEFSAENALFDINLLATQSGAKKNIATSSNTFAVPCFQTLDITEPAASAETTTVTLSHTPLTTAGHYLKVYTVEKDGTIGEPLTKTDTTPSNRTTYTISGKVITVAYTATDADLDGKGDSGFTKGEQLFVMYDYTADGADPVRGSDGKITTKGRGAVEVVNSATQYPVGCKFIMEILGCDVCDQTSLIYAYLIFPNAKLSPDFDWTIATDSTHPFSMKAMQEYCDKEKKLFSIIIPE